MTLAINLKRCSRCDGPNQRAGQRYCRPCQTTYAREWRKSAVKTNEERKRESARSYCHQYEKRGYLHRTPCCICGASQTELHHPDYSRPLYVFSLCRDHHAGWHALERSNPEADFLKWLPPGSRPAQIGLNPEIVAHGTSASVPRHPRA